MQLPYRTHPGVWAGNYMSSEWQLTLGCETVASPLPASDGDCCGPNLDRLDFVNGVTQRSFWDHISTTRKQRGSVSLRGSLESITSFRFFQGVCFLPDRVLLGFSSAETAWIWWPRAIYCHTEGKHGHTFPPAWIWLTRLTWTVAGPPPVPQVDSRHEWCSSTSMCETPTSELSEI